MIECPSCRPAPAHTVNTWAEHKIKQALHKLGLILFMWHKRGLNPCMQALPVQAELGIQTFRRLLYSFVNVRIPWWIACYYHTQQFCASNYFKLVAIYKNKMELRLFFSEGDSLHFLLFSWTLLFKDHWDTQSAICCALLAPLLPTTKWNQVT